MREVPGVEAAAVGTGVPLTNDHWRDDITVEGMALPKPGSFPHPDMHIVSPAYFSTLGIPVLQGRAFTDMDNENGARVAIISALVAKKLFAGRAPVGSRFLLGRPDSTKPPQWLTVIGEVGNTKLYGLANPSRLEVYLPFHQIVPGSMTLLVKSAAEPAVLTSEIRRAVASIDKDQPVYAIATMKQYVRDSVSTRRITFIVLDASAGSHWCWPVLASMASSRTLSLNVSKKSEFAWHWAPSPEMCCEW